MINPPKKPENAFRIKLDLTHRTRLDTVLLEALKTQDENSELKNISRGKLKELFKKKSIQIKGQNALPSSLIAVGSTFVDVLGFI